ncbi:MAG: GIY-YIG nuclease family protein [Candidatus Azobacteroides sp.]|nr:GIY-YIG nuclease family protein [Candidatus Azobacteroides sp.]
MGKTENYGIVYVLSNPAMPDLVKIGMTTRNEIDSRMRELYSTGVPFPFECEYACKVRVDDCLKIEKALHVAFHPYRVNASREFFKILPEQAIAILKLLDKNNDITQEVTAEINEDITTIDKIAARKFKQNRRPPLNFSEMGIPVGSVLQFKKDEQTIEVEVCANRKVLFNNTERSLTSVTQELLGLDYNVQPTHYWTYNGENLGDIYNKTYTTEE